MRARRSPVPCSIDSVLFSDVVDASGCLWPRTAVPSISRSLQRPPRILHLSARVVHPQRCSAIPILAEAAHALAEQGTVISVDEIYHVLGA